MSAADIFGGSATDHIARYQVRLQVRNQLVGGIPSDPSIVRKWLGQRLELGDAALEELLTETIAARDEALSVTDKVDAVMHSPHAPSVNGFKRIADTGELALEARCVKAGLKEAMNSAYPGVDWPGKKSRDETKALKKGLMRYAAEAVHVEGNLIGLGVKADEVSTTAGVGVAWREERIKHIMTPQGPRSAINTVEVVRSPVLTFVVRVRDDFLPVEAWGRIWATLEDIGIGSDRARGDGQFDLAEWTKL